MYPNMQNKPNHSQPWVFPCKVHWSLLQALCLWLMMFRCQRVLTSNASRFIDFLYFQVVKNTHLVWWSCFPRMEWNEITKWWTMVANGFSSDSPKFGAQLTLSRLFTTLSVKLHNHTFAIVLIAPQLFSNSTKNINLRTKVSIKISISSKMLRKLCVNSLLAQNKRTSSFLVNQPPICESNCVQSLKWAFSIPKTQNSFYSTTKRTGLLIENKIKKSTDATQQILELEKILRCSWDESNKVYEYLSNHSGHLDIDSIRKIVRWLHRIGATYPIILKNSQILLMPLGMFIKILYFDFKILTTKKSSK